MATHEGDRDTVVEGNGGSLPARLVFGLTLALIAAGIVFGTLDSGTNSSTDIGFVLAFGAFVIVGYVLSSRRSDNPLSWLMAGIGVSLGLDALLSSYGSYAIHGGIGRGTDLGAVAKGPTLEESLDERRCRPRWIRRRLARDPSRVRLRETLSAPDRDDLHGEVEVVLVGPDRGLHDDILAVAVPMWSTSGS